MVPPLAAVSATRCWTRARTKSARTGGLAHLGGSAVMTERVRSVVRGLWRRTWTWLVEGDILDGGVGCGDGTRLNGPGWLGVEEGLGVTHVEAHCVRLGLFGYISI